MPPFGRRQTETRSPQEREQARLEREARRAAREGRPVPAPPPADPAWADEEPPAEVAPEPVAEAPEPVAEAPEPAAEPQPAPFVPDPDIDDVFAGAAPPHADENRRPAWDDTDAWDPHPPVDAKPVAPHVDPAPAPTLGEEMAAVDRGWFEDEEQPAEPEQQGAVRLPPPEPAEARQETVEWDALAGESKTRPQPQTGPAGVDTPTVEWDAMAEQPRGAVSEIDQNPDAAPVAAARRPVPRPVPRPNVGQVERAERADRFGDADERPLPTRRVNRARTLPPPPPGPGEKRPRRRRGTILAIVALLLVAAALYLVNALFQPLHSDGAGRVRVTIPANSSAGDVGKILEREGVIDSAFFFGLRARLSGTNLKAGNFTLKQGMPYGNALKAVSAQPDAPKTISLTIPEGKARRETAPLVKQAGLRGSYLAASEKSPGFSPRRYGAPRSAKSLEGFLFPATYELAPRATSRDLVTKQLDAFRQNIKGVSMSRARKRNLSTYDVLIIASMIEREATLAKERPLIAAVIYNRLRERMPLGIDATVRFATRNWTRPLRQSELQIDSPYNTRTRTGLPPGPIGSPGLSSIKAAANPAKVDYLFYVVKPNGNGAHNFSSTDAQFEKDVAAYNRARTGNGGKDPSGK